MRMHRAAARICGSAHLQDGVVEGGAEEDEAERQDLLQAVNQADFRCSGGGGRDGSCSG